MAEPVSLMEFVQLLSDDETTRSDFAVDPAATLSAYGLQDLSPADVRDAVVLVEDNRTVDWRFGSGAGDAFAFGTGAAAADGPADAARAVHVDPPGGTDLDPSDPRDVDQNADPDLADVDDVLDDRSDLHLD